MLFCCLNLTFDGCSFIFRKIRQNMSVLMKENLINVFHGTDLFLYLLKTSENCSFSDVFRGYRKRSVPSNGSIWILRSVAVLSTTLVWKSVVKTLKLWKFMCSLYSVLFNFGRNELFFRQTSWVKLVVRDKRFRSKRHNITICNETLKRNWLFLKSIHFCVRSLSQIDYEVAGSVQLDIL